MFVNGVEIIHSKSDHEINYGSITDIAVSSSSDTFEVTQAPKLTITDDNDLGGDFGWQSEHIKPGSDPYSNYNRIMRPLS